MKVLKKPTMLMMIFWLSMINTSQAETKKTCDEVLSKCAKVTKVQKKAIEDQSKTIEKQTELIEMQEDQLEDLEKESDVRTAASTGFSGFLLLLLILL